MRALREKVNNIEERLIRFKDKEEMDNFDLGQETEIVDVYIEGKNS
jgi:hypothetical protein